MNFLVDCSTIGPIIQLLKTVVRIIQYGIPAILIVLIVIDLGQAALASKEDEMKKAQSIAIKRAIYALVIFFVPFIVGVVFSLTDGNTAGGDVSSAKSFASCWNQY